MPFKQHLLTHGHCSGEAGPRRERRPMENSQERSAPWLPLPQPSPGRLLQSLPGLGVVLNVSFTGKGNRPEWAFVFSLSGARWALSRKLCTSPEVKIFPVIREFPAA